MLFIQSITYNLTNGDDGSCERLQTEVACLEPRSAYATGSAKCYWSIDVSADEGGGSCHFVQPDNDLAVVIFVAIFSAVVSTPIALTADWIIVNILSAPTSKFLLNKRVLPMVLKPRGSDRIGGRGGVGGGRRGAVIGSAVEGEEESSFAAITPAPSTIATSNRVPRRLSQMLVRQDMQKTNHKNYVRLADDELQRLKEKLKGYRRTLSAHDVHEFDSKCYRIMMLLFDVLI